MAAICLGLNVLMPGCIYYAHESYTFAILWWFPVAGFNLMNFLVDFVLSTIKIVRLPHATLLIVMRHTCCIFLYTKRIIDH